MSSTTSRKCGKSSLITAPLWPHLLELVRRAEQLGMPLDEREPLVLEQLVGAGLHVVLDQLGLVVEQVLLRRAARHVQVDDALGLGREVRRPGRHRVVGRRPAAPARGRRSAPVRRVQQHAPARCAPRPVCECLRNWRRVCARACCSCRGRSSSVAVHGGSAFGQDAVEVQEHVGDRRPGGQLGRVHARRAAGRAGSVARATAAARSLR